jgi:hypothetical protein
MTFKFGIEFYEILSKKPVKDKEQFQKITNFLSAITMESGSIHALYF